MQKRNKPFNPYIQLCSLAILSKHSRSIEYHGALGNATCSLDGSKPVVTLIFPELLIDMPSMSRSSSKSRAIWVATKVRF